MNEEREKRLIELLETVVENQRSHLARQAEALEMQRVQFQKAENLTVKADKLQNTSLKLLRFAGGALALLVGLYVLQFIF